MSKVAIRIFSIIFLAIAFKSCDSVRDFSCANFPKWYKANIGSKASIDTAKSVELISDFIKKDPNCLHALHARAGFLILTDKLDSAKVDYMRIVAIDNKNVFALYNIGLIFKDQNKYDSSIFFLNKALQPKMNGDFIVEFNTGLDSDKSYKRQYNVGGNEIIYQLGIAYYYGYNWINARKCFTYCVEQHYNAGQSYLYLGGMSVEEKKTKEACDYFAKSKFYGNSDAINYILKYCK